MSTAQRDRVVATPAAGDGPDLSLAEGVDELGATPSTTAAQRDLVAR